MQSFIHKYSNIFYTVILVCIFMCGLAWGVNAQVLQPIDSLNADAVDSVANSAVDVVKNDALTTVENDTLTAVKRDTLIAVKNDTLRAVHGSTLPSVLYKMPGQITQWIYQMPSSKKALLCAIIPGGGQLYNKQYWKIPIVWSLGVGCAYALVRSQSQYHEYHTAYRDFMSPNPLDYDSWKSFVPPGGKPEDYVKNANIRERLKKGSESYRRTRDLSILLSALVYGLTMLDAYVDAELADYDITPNLSLSLPVPYEVPYASGSKLPAVGVQCSLYF